LDEINEIADIIANNKAEKKIEEMIWKTGKPVLKEEKEVMVQVFKEEEKKKGGRRFFKT
jgi:hypothetical protein